jgi:hypothetical protein
MWIIYLNCVALAENDGTVIQIWSRLLDVVFQGPTTNQVLLTRLAVLIFHVQLVSAVMLLSQVLSSTRHDTSEDCYNRLSRASLHNRTTLQTSMNSARVSKLER